MFLHGTVCLWWRCHACRSMVMLFQILAVRMFYTTFTVRTVQYCLLCKHFCSSLVCLFRQAHVALEHCRGSPSRFLAECCKTQLNQGCFVFAVLCLFLVMSVFDLSFVTYFPTYTDVNGTVWPNCADVPLRIYSLPRPFSALTLLVGSSDL